MFIVALRFIGCGLLGLALLADPGQAQASENGGYAPEWVYDTSTGQDESLVNIRIGSNRWPDCHTLQSMIRNIFRIEGAAGSEGETPAKAGNTSGSRPLPAARLFQMLRLWPHPAAEPDRPPDWPLDAPGDWLPE